MNFGGGVNVGSQAIQFYAEARYHYIWGPKASSFVQGGTLPPGVSDSNANGQYFALTFGLRF